jgi:hypothetical protein
MRRPAAASPRGAPSPFASSAFSGGFGGGRGLAGGAPRAGSAGDPRAAASGLAAAGRGLSGLTDGGASVSPGSSVSRGGGAALDEAWEIDAADLQLGPRIGIGSFAEVFRAQWRQTDVAVKRFLGQDALTPRLLDAFCEEVALMQRLRHPNILQFVSVEPAAEARARARLLCCRLLAFAAAF